MKIALLIGMTLLGANAFSKDSIILIGGGGEPLDAKETQFDGSMENLGDFYQDNSSNYSATVNFNGGHSKTESSIAKKFSGADIRRDFTSSSYNSLIAETIKKINDNKISSGEKILLFIDSHGTESSGLTHNISTTKSAMTSMNSGGASVVSLDKIQELSELAEKKGIKLGIIDGSCHAGNTITLGNSKTCVVAASGPKHYSYSDFPRAFAGKMKKGKNLEEIYLDTRNEMKGKGFPMISTPAGMQTQDELYPYLTPYMYYHDEYRGMALDKIDNYMREVSSNPDLMCKRNDQFSKLTTLLSLIQDMSRVSQKTGSGEAVDLSSLKNKIDSYKKVQDAYFKKLDMLNLSTLDKTETITTAYFKSGNKYTHRELLSTDYEAQVRLQGKIFADSSNDKKEKAKNLIDFYKAAQVVKERVLRENPQYKAQEDIISGLKNDSEVGFKVALDIMDAATTAYNASYKLKESEILKKGSNPANPCKDFVL